MLIGLPWPERVSSWGSATAQRVGHTPTHDQLGTSTRSCSLTSRHRGFFSHDPHDPPLPLAALNCHDILLLSLPSYHPLPLSSPPHRHLARPARHDPTRNVHADAGPSQSRPLSTASCIPTVTVSPPAVAMRDEATVATGLPIGGECVPDSNQSSARCHEPDPLDLKRAIDSYSHQKVSDVSEPLDQVSSDHLRLMVRQSLASAKLSESVWTVSSLLATTDPRPPVNARADTPTHRSLATVRRRS